MHYTKYNMTKHENRHHAKQLHLFDALLSAVPGVERKGASTPYTSVNGNVFAMLDDNGLGLRLPSKVRDLFLIQHKTKLFETHGTVLKDYVLVPERLLENTDELKPFFLLGYDHASSLKPKEARKKAEIKN